MSAVRDRIRANPASRSAYRAIVGFVGFAIAVAGVAMLALPGPGLLVLFVGLAILASEFHWARRIQQFAKRETVRWARWMGTQPMWLRIASGLVSALLLLAILYLSLRFTGVPDWTPDLVQQLVER